MTRHPNEILAEHIERKMLKARLTAAEAEVVYAAIKGDPLPRIRAVQTVLEKLNDPLAS